MINFPFAKTCFFTLFLPLQKDLYFVQFLNCVYFQFVHTIWSQRHLCPVLAPISPIIPHFDDSLLLQFNPDLLITADKFMPFVWSPEATQPGATTINPGSFGVNCNRMMIYWPKLGRVELEEITAKTS